MPVISGSTNASYASGPNRRETKLAIDSSPPGGAGGTTTPAGRPPSPSSEGGGAGGAAPPVRRGGGGCRGAPPGPSGSSRSALRAGDGARPLGARRSEDSPASGR